jgi:hypothetical protein
MVTKAHLESRACGDDTVAPGRGGLTMLIEHQHKPGGFDPGHCRDCARETDLLDHYHRIQREEQTVKQAHRWAWQARRNTIWRLWSSGIGILLAAIALLN